MTVRETNLQNRAGGVPAEDHRLIRSWFQPGTGLHAFSGVLPAPVGYMGEVTLLTPETIRVNPGRWLIAGTQSGTQGDYVVVNDAPVERAVAPRDATLNRLDRLVVSVRDTAYTPNEGADDPDVRVIPGTPVLAGAVLPDAPPNSLTLGTITVPPGSGVVTFTPIIVPQQVPIGGVQPTRPGETLANGGYEGQLRIHPTLGLQQWTTAGAGSWGPLNVDRLRAPAAPHLSLSSTGHPFQLGPDSGTNLALDPNTVQARNAGAPAALGINNLPDDDGAYGTVVVGAALMSGTTTGSRAQAFVTPRLRVTATDDAQAKNPDGTGSASTLHAVQIGADDDLNVIMDPNELVARLGNGRRTAYGLNEVTVATPTEDTHPARLDTLNGPVVRVTRSGSGGLANNAWTTLTWDAEGYDSHGMWSAGANVVCRREGFYWVTAGFAVNASVAGRRAVRVLRDGVVMPVGRLIGAITASADAGVEASGVIFLAEDAVVTVQVYQDSGASQSVSTADYAQTTLQMMWQRFRIP